MCPSLGIKAEWLQLQLELELQQKQGQKFHWERRACNEARVERRGKEESRVTEVQKNNTKN